MIQAMGARKSAAIGGVMMAAGLMMSVFADGTLFLIFSIGVVTGSGQGIILNSIIVCVSQYFDRRRGIALGINMAGATVASLVFPNVYELLLSEYGLRGTLLVLGASLLHVPVLSLLMRTPPWEKAGLPQDQCRTAAPRRVSLVWSSTCGDHEVDQLSVPPQSRKATMVSVAQHAGSTRRSTIYSVHDRTCALGPRRGTIVSFTEPDAKPSRRGTLVSEHPSVISRRGTLTSSVADSGPPDLNECRARRGTMLSIAGSLMARRSGRSDDCRSGRRRSAVSIVNSCHQLEVPPLRRESLKIALPTIEEEDESASSSALQSALQVLKTPSFYLHAMSYTSWSFFLDSFLTVMFDYAQDIGVSSDESVHGLTFFSAMDTVGRLFVPFLSDYGIISNCGLLTMAYLLLGLLQQLAPFIRGNLAFWVLAAFMGMPSGYIMVGAPEILATEIGTANLPIAFGFMTTLAATGGFVRPPVISFFRDNYGTYDGVFRLMGGLLVLSFTFTLGVWITGRCKNRTKSTVVVPDTTAIVAEPLATLQEEDTVRRQSPSRTVTRVY
ncbi:monocarboxylate transporter 9-like [Haemaphysalis longicornis]